MYKLIVNVIQNWCSDVGMYSITLIGICLFDFIVIKLFTMILVLRLVNCTYVVLFVITGVPAMVPSVLVDDNTININGNIVTLALSWGEPFNNLDSVVNYTVSCSGDVTCDFTTVTTDNTTRSYTITNLTPMTDYTFSVVATNSIGSGEAGVVMITTPGEA